MTKAIALVLLLAPSLFAQVGVSDKVVNADRYPEVNISFPGGVTGIPKITYYKPSSRPVLLDLYLPPGGTNSPHPLIVYVHGGGWSGGTQRTTGAYEDWPGVLASISAKGYVILLPGINHSWIGKTHEATIAASRTALEKTINFIDATIGGSHEK